MTDGLLAKELVPGQRQYGNELFLDYGPAEISAAGDPDDPSGPTYRTFQDLLNVPPTPIGQLITATLDRNGVVRNDPELARYGVNAVLLVPETNHTVASHFGLS